jgi:osmoprotectant transport system substrate-binding protein
MKSTTLRAAAGAVALTAALAACGSSGSSHATTSASAPAAAGPSTSTGTSAGTSSSAPAATTDTIASKLILGGPPEFKTRVDGISGLAKDYGVTFEAFKALDAGGPLTINALKNGQIDAGDIFTTDPSIKADGFVALAYPKNLYTAQNVLPLINKAKATAGVTKVLDAVSAKLTTADLVALNVSVISNKVDPDAAAKAWLKANGLDATGTEAGGAKLTVGSANFQENVTIAEIYAEALKDQGATISTKLNIGSRETYIPGLKDGSIDLIPEYSGVLLQYFQPTATAATSPAVYAALQKAVPAPLTVLTESAAQDKDAIVVTKATAAKYGLASIADLAKPAS